LLLHSCDSAGGQARAYYENGVRLGLNIECEHFDASGKLKGTAILIIGEAYGAGVGAWRGQLPFSVPNQIKNYICRAYLRKSLIR